MTLPTAWLQFGHGGEAVETGGSARRACGGRCSFNSATAVKPWRRSAARAFGCLVGLLQFGHGGEAVETSDYCHQCCGLHFPKKS